MRGLFVTLEGGEGAGKSTQARRLADSLSALGHPVLLTREPGGAPGAERLRTLLLAGDHGLSLQAEILVHFASRFDHLDHTVLPAIGQGTLVVCDRFTDSSLAYQGYGLGHGDPDVVAFVRSLVALTPLRPDLTLLLDLPRALARERMAHRAQVADRYERLDEAFHVRVAAGFRTLAAETPARTVVVDAAPDAETVHRALLREVVQRLPA